MTRITFPYLAFITLATLHSGTLNAHGYFSAAAFAPVLLNLFVVGFLAARLPLSQRRRGGVLGRVRFRHRAARAADGGSAPARRARAARRSAPRSRREAVLRRARAGGDRLGRPADRHPRRHDPRVAAAQQRELVDVLRRAPLPTAARRDRRRGGHGAVAGNEPAPRRRRRARRGGGAEPLDRAHLRPRRAVLRRLSRAARGDDARRVPARRLHRPGGARLGRGARRLRARAGADGAHPLGGGELPVARRHDDADAVLLRRAGGQSRAQARPLPADGARRPRARRRRPAPGSISPC